MSLIRAIPRATSAFARTPSPVFNQIRNLSLTAARKSDHGDHYDPPSGWLFGVKPGEKVEKEGIQTWALEEARRRLEVEGILKEPEDKS
ncbi:hypothetical protein SBOR_5633 [Sclerotinia borealis F-4128]|uniref:Uncharacterized protein n=1 Tax=Sclerotinia borealis (strain F-4128) TaxID=1432307 RepID=W9CB68_SCLBF|nr:hypothetical protein SBOR_5633 [Sclerotinia borealis F-4128]